MKIIGRREKIDFPELGLEQVEAKVDTGAYTSSLHVTRIQEFFRDGKTFVRFKLFHPSHPDYRSKELEVPVHSYKKVRSSNGEVDDRYIIKTATRIMGRIYRVEYSLSDRTKMESPVLLGRKLLRKKFMVDVSQKYTGTKNGKK